MAIKTVINTDSSSIEFKTTDGESFTFDLAAVHPDNRAYAVLHGFKQRLVDNAAIGRDSISGKSATDGEKMAAIRELGQFYMSGASDWTVRSANGGTGEQGGLIARAVAAVQGVSVELVLSRLDEKAEKMGTTRRKLLNQLATATAVKEKMVELAPKAAVDADELLADLVGGADNE